MPTKTKQTRFEKLFGPRVGAKIERGRSDEFRKLTPAELRAAGRSPKSEGYVPKWIKRPTAKSPIISKRQVQQKRLFEETGRHTTLERRAEQYQTGERVAKTARQETMREKSLEAWGLRLKYKGETVSRVREHLINLEIKKQGGQLDGETWKREKAFSEAHLEVPEVSQAYRAWFNYGHVKRAAPNATGRTGARATSSPGRGAQHDRS